MTKTDAEALSAKLREGHIDHEIRCIFMPGQENYSVRADLKPYTWADEEDRRAYAKRVIDLMTGWGDWCFSGELGRPYVSRY